MSVIIKNINHYRDGGTISIDCWISYRGEILQGESPLITIDYSIGSDTHGDWYFGWKNKGGKMIEDQEFKDYVVKGIEEHIQLESNVLNRIKLTMDKENLN